MTQEKCKESHGEKGEKTLESNDGNNEEDLDETKNSNLSFLSCTMHIKNENITINMTFPDPYFLSRFSIILPEELYKPVLTVASVLLTAENARLAVGLAEVAVECRENPD